MDLKNGNILIRQLEANPKAKELMLREFPMLSSQLIRLARNMTLSQVLDLVKSFHVPQSKINRVLQQLKKIINHSQPSVKLLCVLPLSQ